MSLICVAGKNEIAVRSLLTLKAMVGVERLAVCPNRSDDGSASWQPSLARFARELHIPILSLDEAYAVEGATFLSLEFDRIVRPERFDRARLLNLHFSALPAYKGSFTSALPILHGVPSTGVTLHRIDAGIDTGDIVSQRLFDIDPSWTARDLYFEYMRLGYELISGLADSIVNGDELESRPQSAEGSSYYSRNCLDYSGELLDLRDTAFGLVRQLRAFSFREFQVPVIFGMPVGGWRILDSRSTAKPGAVVSQDGEGLVISTIDYDLYVTRFAQWDWFSWIDSGGAVKIPDKEFINERDRSGWTPLIRACWMGDPCLVARLIESGADVNLANPNGTTPLMFAHSSPTGDQRSVIDALLAAGADPSALDGFGRSLSDYHPGH